jgi:hypothetical protein
MASVNVTIDDVVIDHDDYYEAIRKSFTRDPFDHYVNGLCGLVICLVGTVSNALSFSILTRRTMQLSTYVYLAGLCLSDFTACLFLIPGYILDAYPIEVPDYDLPRTYAYTRCLIIAGRISSRAGTRTARVVSRSSRSDQHDGARAQCLAVCRVHHRPVDKYVAAFAERERVATRHNSATCSRCQ